jgi:hypothetical protein
MRGGSDGPWITPPLEGIQFDNLGPSRDYLIDTSRLYDQAVYTNIHAKTTEWELVDEK